MARRRQRPTYRKKRKKSGADRGPAAIPTAPDDAVEAEGMVTEQLRNATFRVELENGKMVLAHTAGKMRRFRIRIMPGDRVRIALSPYDLEKGRIIYRHRT